MSLTSDQATRYSRHFVLKEIGVKGQKKLFESRVLVIGAGGLGSAALMYLAAAGVGTLGIADYDKVDLSNLQRQIIHGTDDVGKNKTLSARDTINALNPDVRVIIHDDRLSVSNIMSVIKDYDFILDCTDRFETKFLINDACVLGAKPYSHAGVVRFGGQLMTYVPDKGPCLRCLLGGVPSPSERVSCADVGVLGAAVGVIGSIQALEAVKYLLGIGELLTGKVLHFDGLMMKVGIAEFKSSDPRCEVCGKAPRIKNLWDNRGEYETDCQITEK